MPESAPKECTVTAIYPDGQWHSLTIQAVTVYRAILAFNSQAICSSSLGIPRPQMDTRFEVHLPDGRKVERTFKQASDWANRKAAEDTRRAEERARQ